MFKKEALIVTLLFLPFLFSPVGALFGGGVSVDQIKKLLLDSRQLGLMQNSLILSMGALICSLALGVPYAFLISRTNVVGRKLFNSLYLLPLLCAPYIHAMVWTTFFESGSQNSQDGSFIHSLAGGVFLFTIVNLPIVIAIVSSGFKGVNRSLENVSLLTHGSLKTIWTITLRMVLPHILFAGAIVFVFTIVNFEVADVLRLKVYPLEIFIQFSAFYDEQSATVLALPIIALIVTVFGAISMITKGKSYTLTDFSQQSKSVYTLKSFHLPALVYLCIIVGVTVLLPFGVLFWKMNPLSELWNNFYDSADVLWFTFWVAAVSAGGMVVIGAVIAYLLQRSSGMTRGVIDFATQIPLGIPSIVLGIGLIKVWNKPVLDVIYDSPLLLILGFVIGYVPFVMRIIAPSMKQVNERLEQVAAFRNGSRYSAIWNIIIPLLVPGLGTGFLVGLVLAMGNLGTALLVVSPGSSTVPIKMYNYMHYGSMGTVYSLAVIQCLILALIIVVIRIAIKRYRKRAYGSK